MTNYSFEGHQMRKRQVSVGTCECNVYYSFRNPNREVTIFTTNENKWKYLNFLGLTTTPQELVHVQDHWCRQQWRFNAVKLNSMRMEWDEWWAWRNEGAGNEINAFENAAYNSRILELDPSGFTFLRFAVEFCQKYKLQRVETDCHSGNFMKCPVTGIIYPYDVFHLPKNLESNL